jgi:hypothetical protein
MKIIEIKSLINKINETKGYINAQYNTIGAIILQKDICGIGINKITNEHGGVHELGYGMTKKEAYYFLQGLLQDLESEE